MQDHAGCHHPKICADNSATNTPCLGLVEPAKDYDNYRLHVARVIFPFELPLGKIHPRFRLFLFTPRRIFSNHSPESSLGRLSNSLKQKIRSGSSLIYNLSTYISCL